MMPIVDGLEREFPNTITIVRLDAGEPVNVRLQTDYGVRGHPSFVVLNRQNQVTNRFFGPQTEETLRSSLIAVQ